MPESNKATGISDHGTTCRRLAPRQFGRNGAHTPKAEEAGAASAAERGDRTAAVVDGGANGPSAKADGSVVAAATDDEPVSNKHNLWDTGNGGEAALGPATAWGPGAVGEDAAPGARRHGGHCLVRPPRVAPGLLFGPLTPVASHVLGGFVI